MICELWCNFDFQNNGCHYKIDKLPLIKEPMVQATQYTSITLCYKEYLSSLYKNKRNIGSWAMSHSCWCSVLQAVQQFWRQSKKLCNILCFTPCKQTETRLSDTSNPLSQGSNLPLEGPLHNPMLWGHLWTKNIFLCFFMCLLLTIIIFITIRIINALSDPSSFNVLCSHSTTSKPKIACQPPLISFHFKRTSRSLWYSWHCFHAHPMPDPKSLAASISTPTIIFITILLSTHLCICQCNFLSVKQWNTQVSSTEKGNSF